MYNYWNVHKAHMQYAAHQIHSITEKVQCFGRKQLYCVLWVWGCLG